MDECDVVPNMRVRYNGKNKFGLPNEDTGRLFYVVARHFDQGGDRWLFDLQGEWGEDDRRFNVAAKWFEPVEERCPHCGRPYTETPKENSWRTTKSIC